MSDGKEPDAKHVANLVMIVGRLVQQVRKHDSDNPVVEKAMDYLRRCDLTPSIVRGVSEPGNNAGYKFGHRDARHVAAELAIEADRIAEDHADWFDPSIEKIVKALIQKQLKRTGELISKAEQA